MVQPTPLPEHALLAAYARAGAYADCYRTEIAAIISHAAYVEAFYTTWLFKLERLVLQWLAAKPSTDAEAAQLASGARDSFAAWTVEGRTPDQLLLCDFRGKTRSWLMVEPAFHEGSSITRLYFGSALVPAVGKTGRRSPSLVFRALLAFHQFYSRALLRAARQRLS